MIYFKAQHAPQRLMLGFVVYGLSQDDLTGPHIAPKKRALARWH
ncbi:hypothetical protein [Vreelandella venusta]|nr:hypothetical protein [Halomonas venusta]